MINLLIDLNGTCHIGDTPTRDAVNAICKLRAFQKQDQHSLNIRFCSNTTKESSASLLDKLRKAGFHEELVSADDLFTSLEATKRLIDRSRLSPLLLLSESAQIVFRQDGRVAHRCFFADAAKPPSALSTAEASRLRACDAVVIGLCPELMTQAWLDEAFRLTAGEYKSDRPALLIATHRALYHRPSADQPLSLGPGAFISALEAASQYQGNTTTVCGKPSREFLSECLFAMRNSSSASSQHVEETNYIVSSLVHAGFVTATILTLPNISVRTRF
ncbi:hypothetical protein BCV70DRAFT_158296 [Testicularia cyperi]|uniref:HAD-like protein n=1 Tax=Testicularia cyperi TaxID=1882483 RepID=A0A317XWE8_9BASI|nr:hypothetical protein BCV70DRAFT_158296 [Testicularia cyperi]